MQVIIPSMVHFPVYPTGEVTPPRLSTAAKITVVNQLFAVLHSPIDIFQNSVDLFEAGVSLFGVGKDLERTYPKGNMSPQRLGG
jgi:hypothetical protein